ncbi:GGDEF domain-containing protein [Veronia nyctiphanis]|uniref:GGDEF domain-containing protein n=1 Tax=Veronia nyctiphanis TaxID=1278244 RepID=UPI001F36FE0B|nr:GGDEF domain-containing protein [Veronia nyctiphanis]
MLEEFRAKSGNSFTSIDILLKRKLKNPDRWVHCLFSKVEDMDAPDATLIELVVYDITERAEREQSIIFEAEHDPITHLLNRRAAMSKLSSALRHVEEAGRYFALMMIDLDGFKRVNDTYGHDAGDKVIIEVAKCIRQFFRNSDIVARWGGDEFLIGFSYSPEYESAVRDIANDLQFQIAMPVDIGHEQTAKVGSSIGISLFPQNSKNLHTLIEQADHAMYHVKNNGKNFYHSIPKKNISSKVSRLEFCCPQPSSNVLRLDEISLISCSANSNAWRKLNASFVHTIETQATILPEENTGTANEEVFDWNSSPIRVDRPR